MKNPNSFFPKWILWCILNCLALLSTLYNILIFPPTCYLPALEAVFIDKYLSKAIKQKRHMELAQMNPLHTHKHLSKDFALNKNISCKKIFFKKNQKQRGKLIEESAALPLITLLTSLSHIVPCSRRVRQRARNLPHIKHFLSKHQCWPAPYRIACFWLAVPPSYCARWLGYLAVSSLTGQRCRTPGRQSLSACNTHTHAPTQADLMTLNKYTLMHIQQKPAISLHPLSNPHRLSSKERHMSWLFT